MGEILLELGSDWEGPIRMSETWSGCVIWKVLHLVLPEEVDKVLGNTNWVS